MTSSVRLRPVPDDVLRIAVAAHVTRYRGQSRIHTESDLHLFLRWCAERQLDPLAARRVDVELFVRWPILRNRAGARMDRHAATRRLKHQVSPINVEPDTAAGWVHRPWWSASLFSAPAGRSGLH